MSELKEIAQKIMREDVFILDVLIQKNLKDMLQVLDYAVKKDTGKALSKVELVRLLEEMVLLNGKYETLEEFIFKLTDKNSVVAIAKVNPNVDRGLLGEADAIYCIKEGIDRDREKTIRLIDKDLPEGFTSVWLVKREKKENVEELARFLVKAVDWKKKPFVIAIPHLGVKIGDYGYPEVIVRDYGVSISIPFLEETKKSLGFSYSTEYLKDVIAFGEKMATEPILPNSNSEIYMFGNKMVVKTGVSKALNEYNIHVCEEALREFPVAPDKFIEKHIPNIIDTIRGISP